MVNARRRSDNRQVRTRFSERDVEPNRSEDYLQEAFDRLAEPDGFIAYLMNGPSLEGLPVQRDQEPMRDAKL